MSNLRFILRELPKFPAHMFEFPDFLYKNFNNIDAFIYKKVYAPELKFHPITVHYLLSIHPWSTINYFSL